MLRRQGPELAARKRLVWVSLFLFSLFCLLIVQFFKIQIIQGEKWTRQARAQHQLVVTEPFKRGLFYSNSAIKLGHPESPQAFVIDVPKFHLYSDPKSIPPECRSEVSAQVCSLLKIQGEEAKKLRGQFDVKSRSRKMVLWLEKEQCEALNTWWFKYARAKKIPRNALFFVQDYKRSYPFGKLLGQVLHSVREEKDAKTRQSIPTGGLEMIFDKVLQGKEGKRQILRSPRHPIETGKILSAPEDGADVYLTINHHLQAIAEEEIAKAVKSSNAKGGWAVMMDPRTGEIWALAQYPYFEPGDYRRYFNNPSLLEHTKVKAITDPYEPGSTMKPLTLALALKANEELKKQGKKPLFSPQEKMATLNGGFPRQVETDPRHKESLLSQHVPGSPKILQHLHGAPRPADRRHPGREMVPQRPAGDFWVRGQDRDRAPSESPGVLPTPGKIHPSGKMEWSTPTPFSLAFGHNILVSSLQMLRSYAVIANGGL